MKVVILGVLAACGTSVATAPPLRMARGESTCRPSDVGDPQLFTLAADGVIGSPTSCGPNESYIPVVGHGSRAFSVAEPGKASGCLRPGPDCTTVDLGAFLSAVTGSLKARGVQLVSWGIGACGLGKSPDRPADRHFGIIIYDWRKANDTVSTVAAQLQAWDVGQALEVSVEPIQCTQDLSAERTASTLEPTAGPGFRWRCDSAGCTLGPDVDAKQCGDVRCGDDQTCCNPSCGVCVAQGGYCFAVECMRGALR